MAKKLITVRENTVPRDTTYEVDDAMTPPGFPQYVVPEMAQVTGGWFAPGPVVNNAPPDLLGNPLTAPSPDQYRQMMFNLKGLIDMVGAGRFDGKAKVFEEGSRVAMAAPYLYKGAVVLPFYLAIMATPGVEVKKNGGPGTYLNVRFGPQLGNAVAQPTNDGQNLRVVVELQIAIARGLVYRHIDGNLYAVTDKLFLNKWQLAGAVGVRKFHRDCAEPARVNMNEDKWGRDDVDKAVPVFSANFGAPEDDESAFLSLCAAWLMGIPQRVIVEDTEPGALAPTMFHSLTQIPMGQNTFQYAHRGDYVGNVPPANGVGGARFPRIGVGIPGIMADVEGKIEHVDPANGFNPTRGANWSDASEIMLQVMATAGNRNMQIQPYGISRFKRAGNIVADLIVRKRFFEMRRGRNLDTKYVESQLEMGKGNYGFQDMSLVLCYQRTAVGDWVVDPTITTWEAWEALPSAARANRHAVRGAASGPLNTPDSAQGDVWRLTAFLTEVLFASDEVVRAFLRKEARLEKLAGEASLLNDVLPPEVAQDFRICCGLLAQMMKPFDMRARLAETNLVGFAETQGLGIDVSGHPFSAWLEKQGERTPRGILIPGSDLDRLLRSNCAHAAYIVRVWAVTLAKVYVPRTIPADVSVFMSEFRKTDALGNRILEQLRQPGYEHRFDEVCLWFEKELYLMTKRWWKDVWQWVRDLGIGNVGIPATSTDPDFGSTIAIVDSPSGYQQARRIETGSHRVLSPGPWLRSALIGLFAAYAATVVGGAYIGAAPGTSLGLGFFVGLQAFIIWRVVEGYIGYRILWRRLRLWFIKTMTGEAEVSIFTIGTWILPAFLFLLPPAFVLLKEMAQLAAPGMPCEDTRNWGCELAMREVLGHVGLAFVRGVLVMSVGTFLYKKVLGSARHHMFHNIKEPGEHLNFLFTRDGRPLYGWELEQRVFRVVLAVYVATVVLPLIFALYASQVLANFTLANMWSKGW